MVCTFNENNNLEIPNDSHLLYHERHNWRVLTFTDRGTAPSFSDREHPENLCYLTCKKLNNPATIQNIDLNIRFEQRYLRMFIDRFGRCPLTNNTLNLEGIQEPQHHSSWYEQDLEYSQKAQQAVDAQKESDQHHMTTLRFNVNTQLTNYKKPLKVQSSLT